MNALDDSAYIDWCVLYEDSANFIKDERRGHKKSPHELAPQSERQMCVDDDENVISKNLPY